MDDRLYRMYDKIDEQEQSLIEAKAKKQSIESEKVTGDNIYKILIYFDKGNISSQNVKVEFSLEDMYYTSFDSGEKKHRNGTRDDGKDI